jgi:hypothetical protein
MAMRAALVLSLLIAASGCVSEPCSCLAVFNARSITVTDSAGQPLVALTPTTTRVRDGKIITPLHAIGTPAGTYIAIDDDNLQDLDDTPQEIRFEAAGNGLHASLEASVWLDRCHCSFIWNGPSSAKAQ